MPAAQGYRLGTQGCMPAAQGYRLGTQGCRLFARLRHKRTPHNELLDPGPREPPAARARRRGGATFAYVGEDQQAALPPHA